MVKTADIFTLA